MPWVAQFTALNRWALRFLFARSPSSQAVTVQPRGVAEVSGETPAPARSVPRETWGHW